MCNLIKMELYRLWHAASTWVILIVTVAVTAAFMALTALTVTMGTEQESNFTVIEYEPDEENAENSVTYEVYVNEKGGWSSDEAEIAEVMSSMLQSNLLAILCVILAATYVYADRKNGYIKNIAGQFPNRAKMVTAKFAAIATAVLAYLAAFAVVNLIGIKCLWGSNAHLDSFGELMKILGVHYLLLLGLSAVILWITILAKSSTAGVVMGVLISGGVITMLYELINLLIEKIAPGSDFDINLYTIENCLSSYGVGAASDETIRAIVLTVVYGALAVGFAAWIMRKRDVV